MKQFMNAFLLRLSTKSAFYFSLLFAIPFLFVTGTFSFYILTTLFFTLLLLYLSQRTITAAKKLPSKSKCLICGGNHTVLLYPARKKRDHSDSGSFACSSFDHGKYPDIYYCLLCKNGFLSTLAQLDQKQITNEAHKNYQEVVDHHYIGMLPSRKKTYEKVVQTYQDYFKDKNILEVGAYYGAFASVAKTVVKSYTGLEPSTHACEYVRRNQPEIQLINGPIESIHDVADLYEKFDTVVLFDVIEHLPKPMRTLSQLRRFLKPDGHILFSTINIESTFSIAMGPFWPWFMDMHFYYFSDRGYTMMLHRSGFAQIAHDHFPYWVELNYFLQKVASLCGLRLKEKPNFLPQTQIPIQLGDTVMIVGQKVDLE